MREFAKKKFLNILINKPVIFLHCLFYVNICAHSQYPLGSRFRTPSKLTTLNVGMYILMIYIFFT
jgi:hypothetical protein